MWIAFPARGVEARHQVTEVDGQGRAHANDDTKETTAREADRGQPFINIAGACSRGTTPDGTTQTA
jgi:hypothetical protein